MLVAISGSQGAGKTTILNLIKNMGYPIVDRKTARSVLQEWGVTLQEVNNSKELTDRFQNVLVRRKLDDEADAICSDQLWFTERTYADLFTYALVSLGKNNEYSDWLNRYYRSCMEYNQRYSAVYYLRAGQFGVEHDGTRGSNVHYSRMVDVTMLDITVQMVHPSKLMVIETPDLTQRLDIITVQSIARFGRC